MLFLSFISNSWWVHVRVISLIGADEGLTEKGRRGMDGLITKKAMKF
jgi:hypothetical protein